MNLFRSLFGKSSDSTADSFHPGECWTYHTRPGEEASFLVIRKIESHPKMGEIVHISVFGLHIKNPNFARGFHDALGHMPVSKDSLLPVLKEKVQREIPDGDWEEGYATWRKNSGGVFTVPVSECIQMFETAFNQPPSS